MTEPDAQAEIQRLTVELRKLRRENEQIAEALQGSYREEYTPEPGTNPVKVRTTMRKLATLLDGLDAYEALEKRYEEIKGALGAKDK